MVAKAVISNAKITIRSNFGIANFIPSFPDMFRLAPSSPDYKNFWPIKKTSQQRDVYLNNHCRYPMPMSTSENVQIYVVFGCIRNF